MKFEVGGFEFERPVGWKWVVPSSPMRKAQLAVPGSGGTAGEVTFFHFGPGQGGGVQQNIDRWFAQFGNANTSQEEKMVGETRIFKVGAEGTFQSGMPGGPTTPLEGYALRGAILGNDQNGNVFVKMTGPAEIVRAADLDFDQMVRAAAEKP
ncbi:MAG: hypothetical protein ACKOAS_09855 [Verrucomicrobiota bacterium]